MGSISAASEICIACGFVAGLVGGFTEADLGLNLGCI
jgi:hypothetical protein